jgi:RNA 2',3'-cyclic 3'-phosphodiesterase
MSMRLFAGLEIPDGVAERLTPLMRGVPGAKWRPRENLHLTLCFYGDVAEPDARDLDSALEEVAQTIAGSFGKDAPHALWMGVAESTPLRQLAAGCERAGKRLGLKLEARKFTPHVTMAYLSGAPLAGEGLERVLAFERRHGLYKSPGWTVPRFFLYSSFSRDNAPSIYRPEAEYPLLG